MNVYRCPRCPRARNIVAPNGPIPCNLMFLGECPAKDEDRYGAPFVGRTGDELDNTYLPLIGIPRTEVFVMNSVQCSRPNYDNPLPIDADSCMSVNLSLVLVEVAPVIIVPMGAITCSLWPQIDLERDHGTPIPGTWGSWRGVLWPSYHPSAGMRKTGYMIALMTDFHALGKFCKETIYAQ